MRERGTQVIPIPVSSDQQLAEKGCVIMPKKIDLQEKRRLKHVLEMEENPQRLPACLCLKKVRRYGLSSFFLLLFVLYVTTGPLMAQDTYSSDDTSKSPHEALSIVLGDPKSGVLQKLTSMGLDALALAIIFLGLFVAVFGRVPTYAPVGVILCGILLLIAASGPAFKSFVQFWQSVWQNAPATLTQFIGPEK
ncbi:hypothetical protein [Candidatus Methylacidithermus pantelleriae]|nr:hypothetical protein [Candidatus Methylacidithermus pantelleriae]